MPIFGIQYVKQVHVIADSPVRHQDEPGKLQAINVLYSCRAVSLSMQSSFVSLQSVFNYATIYIIVNFISFMERYGWNTI